jgi:tight adherence protein C
LSELRLLVLAGVALWGAATLALAGRPWFSRGTLAERVRPYLAGGPVRPAPARDPFSLGSFRDVVGPLAQGAGGRLAQLVGVREDLSVRLERVHWPLDATGFRLRQLGWCALGAGAGVALDLAARLPLPAGLLLVVGSPLLAFLLQEHRLAQASAAWQRRLFLELPVVAEQLALLLSAGYSLGAALNRLAARGRGACATDLARVCARIRHGLTEMDAVREWAAVAKVDALDRLVPLLAMHTEAADVGRLVSDEARAIRRDVQRSLVATMERRGQQVWVPVTVAALVPGMIFLAVPFVEALRLFAGQ